ncbi:MAG: hypothetical protein PHC60_04030 [Heliobacteriaceae bacterium]|nr:hypothetical protein [Heliobacteriaceae bacterium]
MEIKRVYSQDQEDWEMIIDYLVQFLGELILGPSEAQIWPKDEFTPLPK